MSVSSKIPAKMMIKRMSNAIDAAKENISWV